MSKQQRTFGDVRTGTIEITINYPGAGITFIAHDTASGVSVEVTMGLSHGYEMGSFLYRQLSRIADEISTHSAASSTPGSHPFDTNGFPHETCLKCGWPRGEHLT